MNAPERLLYHPDFMQQVVVSLPEGRAGIPHTEYVRADLFAALEAEKATVEAANRGLVRLSEAQSKMFDAEKARAERAEALLAEAVEALRPFAEAVKGNYFYQSDDLLISSGHGKDDLRWVIPLGDWRLARALIARIKEAGA